MRVGKAGSATVVPAQLVITHPLTPLRALRRSIDSWFLTVAGAAAAAALLLATWLAGLISRPIAELASKTSRIDLERLDVDFRSDRTDEIGDLSRLLSAMTARLRSGARKLREAERRATLGEVARQVNHDIKNGLIPIRNVVRHLTQVQRETPQQLGSIFAERQGTLQSSIAYLEALAQNYARLSPRLDDRGSCDVSAAIEEVVHKARGATNAELRAHVLGPLPPVLGDPVVLRRILENLVGNAIDSLEARAGSVVVSAEAVRFDSDRPLVRITVEDSGRGMTEQELARAFDDFYTTKPGGTGLGLSVVRRLVLDLNGTLRVATKPGEGTRFTVELPGLGTRDSGLMRDAGLRTRDSGRTRGGEIRAVERGGPSPQSPVPSPDP